MKDLQGYARIYNAIQYECTRINKDIQRITEIRKVIQRYARICKDIRGYARI